MNPVKTAALGKPAVLLRVISGGGTNGMRIMDDVKTTLFQITPEHRFKNALHALNDLGCDYDVTFNGVRYVRKSNQSQQT